MLLRQTFTTGLFCTCSGRQERDLRTRVFFPGYEAYREDMQGQDRTCLAISFSIWVSQLSSSNDAFSAFFDTEELGKLFIGCLYHSFPQYSFHKIEGNLQESWEWPSNEQKEVLMVGKNLIFQWKRIQLRQNEDIEKEWGERKESKEN